MAGTSGDPKDVVEQRVNQWVLDYYFHSATEAFRNDRHEDFAEIRDLVSVLIQRPLENNPQNSRKLRIMQCFSRIEEGEDPDCMFDPDSHETPLESAVEVLDIIQDEIPVDVDLLQSNKQLVKEAAVVVCIRKKQFDKASRIIRKYISNLTKKVRVELLEIIKKRNLNHPLIKYFSFSAIKEMIYQLFETFIDSSPPFLMTVAQKGQDSLTLSEEPQIPVGEVEQRECSLPLQNEAPKTSQTPNCGADCGPVFSLTVIRSQFKLLCQDTDPDGIYRKLCETDYCRQVTLAPRSPLERSRIPEPSVINPTLTGQQKCSMTLKRLVMEKDSQIENSNPNMDTSRHSTPEPPKSPVDKSPQEINRTPETSVISPILSGQHNCSVTLKRLVMEKDSQSENGSSNMDTSLHNTPEPLKPPVDKRPRKKKEQKKPKKASILNNSNVWEEQDTWSGEDELFHRKRSETTGTSNTSTSNGRKQKWSDDETEWIKKGIKKYGLGNWKAILMSYPFQNRTSVMIKDRWRTMKKLGLDT
ncbi:telomeric repeat-binding factor 2 [Pelodytes ibericus]